jgi:hypothetical protein
LVSAVAPVSAGLPPGIVVLVSAGFACTVVIVIQPPKKLSPLHLAPVVKQGVCQTTLR